MTITFYLFKFSCTFIFKFFLHFYFYLFIFLYQLIDFYPFSSLREKFAMKTRRVLVILLLKPQ